MNQMELVLLNIGIKYVGEWRMGNLLRNSYFIGEKYVGEWENGTYMVKEFL